MYDIKKYSELIIISWKKEKHIIIIAFCTSFYKLYLIVSNFMLLRLRYFCLFSQKNGYKVFASLIKYYRPSLVLHSCNLKKKPNWKCVLFCNTKSWNKFYFIIFIQIFVVSRNWFYEKQFSILCQKWNSISSNWAQ